MSEESRSNADAGTSDAIERAERVWSDATPIAAGLRTRAADAPRGRVRGFVRAHWPYLFLPAILVVILFVAALFYVRVLHRGDSSATPFQYQTR